MFFYISLTLHLQSIGKKSRKIKRKVLFSAAWLLLLLFIHNALKKNPKFVKLYKNIKNLSCFFKVWYRGNLKFLKRRFSLGWSVEYFFDRTEQVK